MGVAWGRAARPDISEKRGPGGAPWLGNLSSCSHYFRHLTRCQWQEGFGRGGIWSDGGLITALITALVGEESTLHQDGVQTHELCTGGSLSVPPVKRVSAGVGPPFLEANLLGQNPAV